MKRKDDKKDDKRDDKKGRRGGRGSGGGGGAVPNNSSAGSAAQAPPSSADAKKDARRAKETRGERSSHGHGSVSSAGSAHGQSSRGRKATVYKILDHERCRVLIVAAVEGAAVVVAVVVAVASRGQRGRLFSSSVLLVASQPVAVQL